MKKKNNKILKNQQVSRNNKALDNKGNTFDQLLPPSSNTNAPVDKQNRWESTRITTKSLLDNVRENMKEINSSVIHEGTGSKQRKTRNLRESRTNRDLQQSQLKHEHSVDEKSQ